MKRVVITGIGTMTPFGEGVGPLMSGLESGKSTICRMEGWERYKGLQSLIGAPAEIGDIQFIPRKKRRSMGRLSLFTVKAAIQAIRDAGLSPEEMADKNTGCIIGSTMGGAEALSNAFEVMFPERDLSHLTSMEFFKCVSHTAAMNLSQYLGLKGIVMATSAACASALQAIGTGFDLIRLGRQDIILCGGAEELHPTVTGSFDILFATSTHYNEEPGKSPRPFDRDRDGIVCGEGSGVLFLEEYEHARARGAKIYAEITGYHTCGSGDHISQSNHKAMIQCMKTALNEAGVCPEEIDYVSAHATATIHGDVEEVRSIRALFGDNVPVSSLKGAIGHTLGASGAIELGASLMMMQNGVLLPTLHLDNIDPECDGIFHLTHSLEKEVNMIVKNCFAFGGINASLVCRRI